MWDFYLFGFLDKRVNESGRVEGKSFYSQAEIRFTEYSFRFYSQAEIRFTEYSFRFYSTTLTKVFSEKKHTTTIIQKKIVSTQTNT